MCSEDECDQVTCLLSLLLNHCGYLMHKRNCVNGHGCYFVVSNKGLVAPAPCHHSGLASALLSFKVCGRHCKSVATLKLHSKSPVDPHGSRVTHPVIVIINASQGIRKSTEC